MPSPQCPLLQAGMDVSEQLTRFGAWQPSGSTSGRGPTVADALIGSLGGHGSPEKVRSCLPATKDDRLSCLGANSMLEAGNELHDMRVLLRLHAAALQRAGTSHMFADLQVVAPWSRCCSRHSHCIPATCLCSLVQHQGLWASGWSSDVLNNKILRQQASTRLLMCCKAQQRASCPGVGGHWGGVWVLGPRSCLQGPQDHRL